ncbi:hypothetical protein FJY63_15080, partial [Candidatus Sumerlaeota bacterium]|nr:hypothetical protein [Candidatus Sumerlaeota bacterium]
GGLCDYCIAGFRDYLKKHATPDELAKAGVKNLDSFDYRDLIRKHATTREQCVKVRQKIPLIDLFAKYHLESAAEFVRELGEIGAEAAGHPILLSANAPLHDSRHALVTRYLMHVICETRFDARQGTAKLDGAISTFDAGRRLGKQAAVTAYGWDWSHIKATNAIELVRFWVALTYAHGQWFMVPHPTRQWCFNSELGTHWYQAPIEEFAPLYQFIRANARWFDDFEASDLSATAATTSVICTVRRKGEKGPIVVHVINRDYDAAADRMRPAQDVAVTLPAEAIQSLKGQVRLLSYDAKPRATSVQRRGSVAEVVIPQLRLWTLAVIE